MSPRSLEELWSLGGRVAVITGAGLGLGQAIAYRFVEAGAAVVINDVNRAVAESVASELTDGGWVALAAPGDVAREGDMEAVLDAAIESHGRIDTVVNNAGIVPLETVGEMSLADWDRLMSINTRGAALLGEKAAEHMIRLGIKGSIINVLSVAAVRALQPGLLPYSVSKAGLKIVTEIQALALAEHGIRVNGLLPTVMQTESTRAIPDLNVPRVPLGRLVEPDEVARGAVFLASDMAEFVTGITLPVDGGRLID